MWQENYRKTSKIYQENTGAQKNWCHKFWKFCLSHISFSSFLSSYHIHILNKVISIYAIWKLGENLLLSLQYAIMRAMLQWNMFFLQPAARIPAMMLYDIASRTYSLSHFTGFQKCSQVKVHTIGNTPLEG